MFNRQTRFLLIWIVTNTLAWAVSFLVAYLLGIILYDYLVTTIPSDEPKVSYSFFVSHSHSGLFAFLTFALAAGVIGSTIGVIQWLVLRPWYGIRGRWSVAMSIGWACGILITYIGIYGSGILHFSIFVRSDAEIGAAIAMVLFGSILSSITGERILRRYSSQTKWWMVANSLGWSMGGAITYWFVPLGRFHLIYFGAITGLVGAVLTGLALTRLAISTSNNG